VRSCNPENGPAHRAAYGSARLAPPLLASG
jgi:hypothetical protein